MIIAESQANRRRFHSVLVDARFHQCLAFGAAAARLGERVHSFKADLNDFWVDNIERAAPGKGFAIAGMTTHSALFCLAQLGDPRINKIVLMTRHASVAGVCRHEIHAAPPLVAAADALLAGDDWPTRSAQLAIACARQAQPVASSFLDGPGANARERDTLVSWAIVPVDRPTPWAQSFGSFS
ncbi:hypothetical protein FZ025_04790 [Xanthomonas hyacinthi]|nr:hypothetical protein [Xanthomonas hyacinthi]KLD75647.1 hypothetical protein Y886_25800 [Xanthomonas hyacinthi DSM 19077]QGY76013.1 hypothetical protein FZ025_04790 [Xanthomonas hyacinthi]